MTIQDRVTLNNGRIVLMLADCIEALPKIKVPITLGIADPPYYKIVSDSWDHQWHCVDDYITWSKQWVTAIDQKLASNASLYIFNSIGRKNPTVIPKLILMLDTLDLSFQDMITWAKDRGMGNRLGWVYTREELLWYSKHPKNYIWNKAHQYGTERRKRDKGLPAGTIRESQNGYYAASEFKRLTNVWRDISEQTFDVINNVAHTTPKPIKAIERIVLAHTLSTNDVVCDPFLGSGTTGVVCAKHNRPFIGIEKDPNSFYQAVERIREAL